MNGMATGGPVVIVWGWLAFGVLTLFVGLAMAEVCSAYPTAGGLYFWAAQLARSRAAAWAWFNVLGEVAVTAGIDFGAAFFLNALLDLRFGYEVTPPHTITLFGLILLLHGLLNTVGVRVVALLNSISVWWHVPGVLFIVGVLAFVPDQHQSAGFVFGHFENQTGWTSTFYVAAVGLLLVVVVVARLFCGMASVAANSRMIFAFSRDGALPCSRVWRKVGPKTRLPNNAVLLATGSAFLLGLPYLWNATAYAAVTSIAVIGLYIAYVIPSYLRLRAGDSFSPGPWNRSRPRSPRRSSTTPRWRCSWSSASPVSGGWCPPVSGSRGPAGRAVSTN